MVKHDLCPRAQVVALKRACHSIRETARIIGKPDSFVKRWWNREDLLDQYAGGRPRKVTRSLISAVKQKLGRKTRKSYRIIAAEMDVSISTLHLVARKILNWYPYHRAPKLILTAEHKGKRLAWAQKYLNKNWIKVAFSDEKIVFCVPGRNSKNDVIWAPKGTEVLPAPYDRHSSKTNVSAAVWFGGRSEIDIFDENLASPLYIDILTRTIIPGGNIIGGGGWELLFDGDRKHTSKLTTAFLNAQHIKRLVLPPKSPEPNVIENVWPMLMQEMQKLAPHTAANLHRHIKTAWWKIPQFKIDNCIRSMKHRLELLIEKKGDHIKY